MDDTTFTLATTTILLFASFIFMIGVKCTYHFLIEKLWTSITI